MHYQTIQRTVIFGASLFVTFGLAAFAQSGSTRPRRVTPTATTVQNPTPLETPTPAPPPRPSRPIAATSSSASAADTTRAYALLEQKQYEAAAREAKRITGVDPKNGEAWKIAGFAEFNLKQYKEAAVDLQRALELQRAAGQEDANTVDALGQAYVRTEQFELALPLLVAATDRAGVAKPDAVLLYYRGLAEFRTGKPTDAERSFNAAVKVDPKNAASHFYLGRIASERNQLDAAITALNRATQSDVRFAEAWTLLTYSYLRRAATAGAGPKADADYLSAIRASDSLLKLRNDEASAALHAQALVGAQQFARAALALERFAANPNAQGTTLYLLGVAHSRTKNLPKAVAALERAAAKTPEDVNVYRELGYAYEVSKQYAKALTAYEKGATLAPAEADLKESAERVRPFAK